MKKPLIASVVLSTRNRAASLKETLKSFVNQLSSDWEVIVVDNGSSDETQTVVEEYQDKLPLVCISEPIPGKSRAINRALDIANGELVVFTDDDVRVSTLWLREFVRGCRKHQSAGVFCGPIVPRFPQPVPDWLCGHIYAEVLFADFQPQLSEGPLPPPMLPFGPNFAVRRETIGALKLREDLGPSEDGLIKEETEFCKRLRRMGAGFIFMPHATVVHSIRFEQLTSAWQFERFFDLGRSNVVEAHGPIAPAAPHTSDGIWCLEIGAEINLLYGALYEISRRCASPAAGDTRESIIKALASQRRFGLLAPSAIKWLSTIQ
jgi:glycosyltransferase involved in cell wall biosynthesis